MAKRIRSEDFLPEIFQTPANKQLLRSTLDQLTQNPKLKPTEGYIGRKIGPGVTASDSYVLEPTANRTDYQLEPGVVQLTPNTSTVANAITYPGIIDSLKLQGANTTRADRLFDSEHYSFDPFVDYDKYVNFSQYYWVPSGPNSVDVYSNAVPVRDTFDVAYTPNGYTFSGEAGALPTLTFVRQGEYTFDVNAGGHPFWIQSRPGTSGVLPQQPNQSSRQVLGVANNGDDVGTVVFTVPEKTAQNFYFTLADIGSTDLVEDTLQFNQVNNQYVDVFLAANNGIDGISDLQNRTLIFTTDTDTGWEVLTPFGDTLFDQDNPGIPNAGFDNSVALATDPERYVQWRINFNYANPLRPFMELTKVQDIANLSKSIINYGTDYAGVTWYKNAEGEFERQPLITANLDILYYQDGNDETNFGVIRLVDQVNSADLLIEDIIGKANYTSPNNVVFTNGLKVQFIGTVVPASYENKEYYIEGVGTAIELLPVTDFITPETYTISTSVPFDSKAFDEGNYDATNDAPTVQDYMTMNRASIDQNAWSRSNRWFHIEVLNATATYNNIPLVINNDNRAKRPILEFRKSLKLFNYGTLATLAVDIIDFAETDALSNINGTAGYSVDGYTLVTGSRIIFNADLDAEVRNKIYTVTFVNIGGNEVIDLQPASLTQPDVATNISVVVTSGATLQGKSYWFNGTTWISSQQKTSVNQAPLFDIFDNSGYSFGDSTVYPSTTFAGSKLYSYAVGTGVTDTEIGQPLKYLTIANVGDIVFDNNLYVDTFIYVSGTVSATKKVDIGTVRQYNTINTFDKLLGWQTSFETNTQRQSFSFDYTGDPLVLDIEVLSDLSKIPVKVYVEGQFVLPNTYTYATNSAGVTEITFNANVLGQPDTNPATGSIIEAQVLSDSASTIGFYTIPSNLESNAMNENSKNFTLGTIRTHYETICQNLENFSGKIHGSNNIRDLGNVVPYGELILQQSAPVTMMTNFINGRDFEFFRANDFNATEYDKAKNKILDYVANNDWEGKTAAQMLDGALLGINEGRTQSSPFYWTDAIPGGNTFETTTYTITPITTYVFDTLYSYDFTTANYKGLLVYYTPKSTGIQTILVGDGHEYTVATDGPRITINNVEITLSIGDIITINEYATTYGSYVPATPSMMGLYPVYRPQQFLDNTYVTPTNVIQGHDGSLTVAWETGDYRNAVLLEFEKRCYNNIKINAVERYNPPLQAVDVIPGQFRTTDYTLTDVNDILNVSFLAWVGANRVPYKDQTYITDNEFTWNYSLSENRLSGSPLLGFWRGIYFQLYDTDSPHTRPWEMVGLTEQPTWWQDTYGPAPYTSGNTVLWQDMADGKVAYPTGNVIRKQYIRPELLQCIPTDSQGNLVSPMQSIVGNYDQNSFRKSWVAGDMAPTEDAWRRSSYYPFAIQRLLALTKPAQYFSLFADRDLWKYNTDFSQYLYNNRFRIDPKLIEIYGNGIAKNSYINFIVDYNRVTGLDSTTELKTKLSNIDVRLCYRMAAFSDQNYLKIFSEKSSPNSLNASLLLPDESYQLFLYKNPSFTEVQYSSVTVQRTNGGWSVAGYSLTKPYFNILQSTAAGKFSTTTVNGNTVRIAENFNNNVIQVPYGYVFTTTSSTVDFLVSYGAFLESQGLTFDTTENDVILNWTQMANEFLYWAGQSWTVGSIINLNPAANVLRLERANSVVESLTNENINDVMLNQNFGPMLGEDYAVERIANELKLIGVNNQTFSYLLARFTAYEHIIVFDNVSIFNDLIYQPVTGARQNRLLLNGNTVFDWNGTLDAQGFILNQDNIKEWIANTAYTKGQIVLYKNAYWSSTRLLAPSATFVFADWIKGDYDQIQTGLLPNLATKASNMQENYDIHTANLESDATLLGLGLIGFRPRQYMQNLNLDDISQAGLYSQFLGTKGTITAAKTFTSANIGKEQAEYEIYENWAIQRGIYGANANRSYFELRTDESKLLSNPSTIAVINPGEVSTADQTVLVDNIWKQSYNITSKNILPTIDTIPEDIGLPSAGYVNYDDVELKVFDYDDLTDVVNNLDNIVVGTNIWVAKANSYNWNIYRVNLVNATLVTVFDNLNTTCTLTFNTNHGLLVNQRIIIKFFDTNVDGAYIVNTVPGLKTITITLSLPGDTTTITGDGRCFTLESVRVAQASDVAGLSFSKSLTTGNQVWVDDNGSGKWTVLQKQNPFGTPTEVQAVSPLAGDLFGTTLAQGLNNQGLLVGAPGYGSDVGGVYAFNKNDTGTYLQKTILTPGQGLDNSSLEFEGFGFSLDAGKTQWAIAGAPGSENNKGYATAINRSTADGSYELYQHFNTGTNDEDKFGYSVAVSDDERWMYVSAPADNKVYAYNKIDVQTQRLEFVSDGITTKFPIQPTIQVSANDATAQTQITITRNNVAQVPGVGQDFTVLTESGIQQVVFNNNNIPNENDALVIVRRTSQSYFPTISTTNFSFSTLFTASDIYSFSVVNDSKLLRPFFDYTIVSTDVVLYSPISSGTLTINAKTHWDFVNTFTATGLGASDQFGYDISTTTDGRQIIVGTPDATIGTNTFAGETYVIDRSVERFQVTNASTVAYTVTETPTTPITVTLNGTYLIPTGNANNPQFSVAGSVVTIGTTLNPVTLTVGDIIEIETNIFKTLQQFNSTLNGGSYYFGRTVDICSTNCSAYVNMPNDSAVVPEGGSVERWINQNRLFGTITGTVANPVLTATDSIRINNYYVTLSGTTVASLVTDITTADLPNITAQSVNGALQITLENVISGEQFIKLQVAPGEGTAFVDLGLTPWVYAQTITPPLAQPYSHFGTSLTINDSATVLVVGAPDATAFLPTTFDTSTTYFDSGSTNYLDPLNESGVAYTYDYLNAASPSATNPGKFVYGQQIYDTTLTSLDKFGTSVSYVDGVLLVGSPNDDLSYASGDYGRVTQLVNANKEASWKARYIETPVVDASLLNSVFTYNKVSNTVTTYLDFIDPLQGKIIGAAQANIDYTGGVDPAAYNTGTVNNFGTQWRNEHLGEIWWDLSTVRFIDYHQDDIQYRARRWGQLFNGSSVDVYQWTENTVPPTAYTGAGTVYNTTSYTITSSLDSAGTFVTNYYYWVKGLTAVSSNKTLSSSGITQYISNPRSSGIAYCAAISTSSVALYNCRELISATDTILHVEFDKIENTDNVHSEYDLITVDDAKSFLGGGLYRKFLDSFCGADTIGNLVPDATLSVADKYGVSFRPRQSVFIDRYLALENYMTRANKIMKLYSISDSKSFKLLNSEEPEPTAASGEWNKRLLTYAELTYQDLRQVPVGYKYLVVSDSTQEGLWSIYTVLAGETFFLSRVQTYKTNLYWSYVDWNGINADLTTYSSANASTYDVKLYSNLLALENVVDGAWATVETNSFGKQEVYQYSTTTDEWTRVFLEDGTIAVDNTIWDYAVGNFGFDVEVFDAQRFDQAPITETRRIIEALNQEIFTNELRIFRNELLILSFEFIMSEQAAPDWLFKTSLIDVNHKIRDLIEYPIYRRDNQDFVSEYINEVKPYHVQVREFNLRYEGTDTYNGSLTDFDLPAYYDTLRDQFVSPILDDSENPESLSAVPSTSSVWTTFPWSQWYNNYKLVVKSVTVVKGGTGYTVAPQVIVTGDATTQATMTATVNTAGELIRVNLITPGSGYTTTPTITISGGNGTGSTAIAVLAPQQVRDFTTTIAYNRITYTSQVIDWTANTAYTANQLVRFPVPTVGVINVSLPKVYNVTANFTSGSIFDPENYTVVDPSTLDAADRTIGLYTPGPNEPGRELAQVMTGIDYPGVQVDGPDFDQNTGFDIGNFDDNPFDNIDFGPEGLPTYDPAILDVIYKSAFTDTYLGTRSTDINIEGGGFIDTYSSHAPEELIPGSEFDTLDLRVYTRPGSDWNGDGHGFEIQTISDVFSVTGVTINFNNLIQHPVQLIVVNITNSQVLPTSVYTINWVNKTVAVSATANASSGDTITAEVYGLGGGSQLYKESFVGSLITSAKQIITVTYTEIAEMAIFINGAITTAYTYAASGSFATEITFNTQPTSTQMVTIVALGTTTPVQYSWSTPVDQYFNYVTGTPTYALTNSLQGTNIPNMIIDRDGFRIRPPEGIEYTGDGSSLGPYYLSTTGKTNQALISESDILVYVDNVRQFLSVNWTLSTWDGSSDRYVEFNTQSLPASNAQIQIFTTTESDYTVINTDDLNLRITAASGALFNVTTFNDTAQQNIMTKVYVGPSTQGVTTGIAYDEDDYDQSTFDETVGSTIDTNNFALGRLVTSTGRLIVSLNGNYLQNSVEFYVTVGSDGLSTLVLNLSILNDADVLVVTMFTNTVVPDSLNFRIFQDMLGNQKILRLSTRNTTELNQNLAITDDIVYVKDVTKLSEPNLAANIFGQLMVGGERITYRTRNTSNNTVSGLRRGTAGTGVYAHIIDDTVSDIGPGEQIPSTYQEKTTTDATNTGDGTTKTFIGTGIVVPTTLDSTELDEAVRVSVGGAEMVPDTDYIITQVDATQVEVTFTVAPANGSEIEISIVSGKVMYAQGASTASNGIALQDQTTPAALFLKAQG
jgi:hypothetical protein